MADKENPNIKTVTLIGRLPDSFGNFQWHDAIVLEIWGKIAGIGKKLPESGESE